MDIALFNEKIMIEENKTAIDEIGNHVNKWSSYYSCYSTISGESGSEKEGAGQTISEESISFTVRYCNLLSKLNTTNYRVIFHDAIYNIISIDHNNYKKKSLKLKCKKVER